MLDKIIFASAFTLTSSAIAQTPNPQIIIKEIWARQSEEMQKAILCQVGQYDLRGEIEKLKARIVDLERPKEPAPAP
jgi:hypothetical protein